jgi:hypothetical protein
MLDYAMDRNGLAMVAMVWVDEFDQLVAAFLLPWATARLLQKNHMRTFDNGAPPKPWASMTVERMREACPQFELVPYKLSKTGRGKRIALFTKEEARSHENAEPRKSRHERVPDHLPVPFPLEWHLEHTYRRQTDE